MRKFVRRNKAALVTAFVVGFGILLTVGGLAGSIGWAARDRAARAAALEDAADAALREAAQFQVDGKWPEALAQVKRAEGLLDAAEAGSEVRRRAQRARGDLEMVARLAEIRIGSDAQKVVQGPDGTKHSSGLDHARVQQEYAAAFRVYGIDVLSVAPAEAADQIRARSVRVELAAALDHWAQRHFAERGRLLEVARLADPDEVRQRVRTTLKDSRPDRRLLEELAASDQVARSPATANLLASALNRHVGADRAVAVLKRAHGYHPSDFWVNYHLGYYLELISPPQTDAALRYYTAALAVRPQSPQVQFALGVNLLEKNDTEGAIAAFRAAIRLSPEFADAYDGLGSALKQKGLLDEAITAHRQAVRLKGGDGWLRGNLGVALYKKGLIDEAIAAFREAIRLKADELFFWDCLGAGLYSKRLYDELEATYREMIRRWPNRGIGHSRLAELLRNRGQLDEALVEAEKAVELEPQSHIVQGILGTIWLARKEYDRAIAALREAIRLNPDSAATHSNLGLALAGGGYSGEANKAFRAASARHFAAGSSHAEAGRWDEAAAAFREAAAALPDAAWLGFAVADTYIRFGRWEEAAASYDRGLGLKPDHHGGWYLAAALHAGAGDLDGYRRVCRELVRRFGDTDHPQTAERTAKACLLLPGTLSPDDLDRVQKLGERAVTGTEAHGYFHFFAMAKALAEYRAGRHAAAVKWMERAAPNPDGTHWDATKYAVLAMARHRLGQATEAGGALANARQILTDKMPDPDNGRPFGPANWHDWLHAEILCREAEALLKKK